MKITAWLIGVLAMMAGMQAQAGTTTYNVVETFHEPDTQPRDSIFTGSFSFDDVTKTVSNLVGTLTESMTGTVTGLAPYYDMTKLSLTHQLSAVSDGNGGLLVTTFLNNNTNTFTTNKNFGGTDGWAPGSGYGLYSNFPGTNPGNAYARIYVNQTSPTTPLTQAQIDKLAYADCAPGGMMGPTCMTGTTVAGYGSIGTMSGYPVSQSITVASAPANADVPLPTWAMMLFGSGLLGAMWRKRT